MAAETLTRQNFPIAPDGYIPNSVIRKLFRIRPPSPVIPHVKTWKPLKLRPTSLSSEEITYKNQEAAEKSRSTMYWEDDEEDRRHHQQLTRSTESILKRGIASSRTEFGLPHQQSSSSLTAGHLTSSSSRLDVGHRSGAGMFKSRSSARIDPEARVESGILKSSSSTRLENDRNVQSGLSPSRMFGNQPKDSAGLLREDLSQTLLQSTDTARSTRSIESTSADLHLTDRTRTSNRDKRESMKQKRTNNKTVRSNKEKDVRLTKREQELNQVSWKDNRGENADRLTTNKHQVQQTNKLKEQSTSKDLDKITLPDISQDSNERSKDGRDRNKALHNAGQSNRNKLRPDNPAMYEMYDKRKEILNHLQQNEINKVSTTLQNKNSERGDNITDSKTSKSFSKQTGSVNEQSDKDARQHGWMPLSHEEHTTPANSTSSINDQGHSAVKHLHDQNNSSTEVRVTEEQQNNELAGSFGNDRENQLQKNSNSGMKNNETIVTHIKSSPETSKDARVKVQQNSESRHSLLQHNSKTNFGLGLTDDHIEGDDVRVLTKTALESNINDGFRSTNSELTEKLGDKSSRKSLTTASENVNQLHKSTKVGKDKESRLFSSRRLHAYHSCEYSLLARKGLHRYLTISQHLQHKATVEAAYSLKFNFKSHIRLCQSLRTM